MATVVGSDMMIGTPTTDTFGHSAHHRLGVPGAVDDLMPRTPGLPSPQLSPRTPAAPPNPPFVFPARPTSSSAPSSFSRSTGRRPRSVILGSECPDQPLGTPVDTETRPSRSPALPDFSFNPGAALPPVPALENVFLSPPQSPSVAISTRPGHGHRRGGSEFVGGNIRDGDSITVLSTSPTRSESGMASPTPAPSRAGGPRRGHAHRRSAAISSHDLSSIIVPPSMSNLRGNSAPNSPAAFERPPDFTFPRAPDRPSQSEPSLTPNPEVIQGREIERRGSAPVHLQQPPKSANRNRVGFSDTLEFIPRPLSLVSSDTSSTVTARPGHSVSGSISSIVSASNTERDVNTPLGSNPIRNPTERRPSTAGGVLERTLSIQEQESRSLSPRRRGSIPYMGAEPSPPVPEESTPSPSKTPKRWNFFGLEPFVPVGSPTRVRPRSASSTESPPKNPSSARASSEEVSETSKEPAIEEFTAKQTGSKRFKKQKKVKAWAGSILSRKSKQRQGKQKRRAPTPPPPRQDDEEEDMDDSLLEMAPEPDPIMPTLVVTETSADGEGDSWDAPRPVSVPDEDLSYQMIDLDAALGPFNTPLPRNPEWEAAQRAGGLLKKQLHSAAGLSRFSGPGMHYSHRRAESAPEMAPFEAGRFGIHRFGSSSTMADVFEEEEEEEIEGSSKQSSTGESTPVAETPAMGQEIHPTTIGAAGPSDRAPELRESSSDGSLGALHSGLKRKGSDLGDEDKTQACVRFKSEHSAGSLHEEVVVEEGLNNDSSMVTNDGSSLASISPRHPGKSKDLSPVDVGPLQLPTPSLPPTSPYSMTQSSSFPSPRSPMSYDANRISTAPSSITEDNFRSLLLGEPGPEVRASIDIPSLTSSNSTMTRESAIPPNPQARNPPLRDLPRPASFTSTAFGRRRSSLASLSRLISTSHGERSKLSMEVPMDPEPEKKAKLSKSKRLSRMMQFWKSKDGQA